MEETEGAPDPLFGVMDLQLLSPTALIQMSRDFLREASPELPEASSPAGSAAPDLEAITASPETITMKETGPITIPAAEFEGEDFLDHHLDTIDLLLAQTDPFREGGAELRRKSVTTQQEERELERGDQEKEKTKDVTGSISELQPTTASSEDVTMLPQEEPGPHAEIPGPPREQITPGSAPGLPSPPPADRKIRPRSPELEEIQPTLRRSRKRQLIFFDPETQISESEQQKQINNPLTETTHLAVPLPSNQRIIPASELFDNPCCYLPDELLSLWRQAAIITPLPGSDLQVGERGPESSESERERERERMEAAEQEKQGLKQIPKEVQREMAEFEMADISADGTLPLEGSDQKEASREISPVCTPDREGFIISRSIPKLEDIPETEAAAETPGLLSDLSEPEWEPVLFQSLLPAEASRRHVSNIFQKLLENLSSRTIRAEQDEPYGDILIFPGVNYEEAHLEGL
ncbi:meiotic recombination protein REC8 homolog [Austrofundulus limnaeus]|uniref:Meiotic recombination protein REC8 homolog n=1 Tax=Austrofundulus limnaeus TaxID=52670 RepID=A0A2I4AXE5_AUSLI|nr:PREDICTED: meiotic recombination protein REC8 homolog [Austrofundulus limnaeus]